ncbi:MAG: hypothetical protein EBT50_00040 [Verrucomicrobia bacterium]|nr:hypothetical protein [Verrucomicrobiota bacterium]
MSGQSRRMKTILSILLALVLVTPSLSLAVSSMEERIEKTIDVLEEYGKAQGDSIPRQVFHDAKGLVVMWVIKAGFLIAGEGGDGLVVIRQGKKWSHPSAISAAGAGVGFQAGGSSQDYVLLLNTEEAVRQFSQKGNYTSSAEVEGTAGPTGRELSAGVATVNAPVYTYSFTKGLFGGVSLSGLGYGSADDTNENFYGQRLTPKEILDGKVKKTPEAVHRLWKALEELDKKPKIEGKTPPKDKKK